MTIGEIVDKIWAEHDHDHDENFLYSDGWTDACNRFHQELQGKSIIEWYKTAEELPEAWENILFCFGDPMKNVRYVFGWYSDVDNCFTCDEDDIEVNKVIAWTYIPEFMEREE